MLGISDEMSTRKIGPGFENHREIRMIRVVDEN
jgi:hypothetical protein